ncbi:MAG: hypothetical protein DRI86_10750 [Bacteroidetes bacterium]|nr:MAG: hypothetical protein DRI86_10750 [Bacteroidota bacterium]
MKVVMFKSPKPKQFSFKTRYWNPEEDERQRIKNRAERQKEDYKFDAKEFKEELKYRWSLNRESQTSFNKTYTSVNRLLLLSLIAAVIIGIMIYMNS